MCSIDGEVQLCNCVVCRGDVKSGTEVSVKTWWCLRMIDIMCPVTIRRDYSYIRVKMTQKMTMFI